MSIDWFQLGICEFKSEWLLTFFSFCNRSNGFLFNCWTPSPSSSSPDGRAADASKTSKAAQAGPAAAQIPHLALLCT